MRLKTLDKPGLIAFCNFNADFQGCGYIRIVFPALLLNQYRYKGFSFMSVFDTIFKKDPNYYRHFSFIKFQRSATEKQYELIKGLKEMGFNFYYELDDLLTGIPEWNYAHEYYAKLEKYITGIIEMSSGMTVSTNKMKEVYSKHNDNIVVIPNKLPKFLWGDIYPKHLNQPREKKPVILWAGSQNHFSLPHLKKRGIDGGDFGSELINFIKKTSDIYDWVLCGACPLELEDHKDKITVHSWRKVIEYPQFIKSIEPDICIAPLEPGIFNECKSDIKVLEYISLGAAGVYSDIEPYKKTYLRAKTDEEMIDHIEKLARDMNFRKNTFNKDFNRYRGQIFWEDNNNLKQYVNDHLRLIGRKLP